MPLILALVRQKQEDLSQFKASLVYIGNSGTARTTQRDPISKNKNNNKKETVKFSDSLNL